MKKILLAALVALPFASFADDSFNKGMKIECLKAASGPMIKQGDQLIIDPAKRKERKEKITLMASKMSATMFTGKSMIPGWSPMKTEIDAGHAVYRHQQNDKMFLVVSKDSIATITVVLPNKTMIEGLNCKIDWMEN